jgi:hypothetical protein
MISSTEKIEATINTVAVRRLGVAETSIIRSESRRTEHEPGGEWFVLSVRLPGANEWTLVGRRRTMHELLLLVSSLDPRHVGGTDLWECQKSTRPVGAR